MGLFNFFTRKKLFPLPPTAITKRAPRITLVPLQHTSFDLHEPFSCAEITVSNISSTGIGLFTEKVTNWPPPDTLIKGSLHLQDRQLDLQLKIIHSNANIAGCCFLNLPDNFGNTLHHYFQIELAAMKISKIAKKYLKEESDGEAHWFRGSDNCELFLVISADKIIRFTISFFGNLIEYRDAKTLRYSRIDHEENELKMKGSDLISRETSVPKEIGESSMKFVMNIKELSGSHRDFICRAIKETVHPGPGMGGNN